MNQSGFLNFQIGYTFKNDAYAVIEGKLIQFWEGMGQSDFEGSIDDFAVKYPDYLIELLQAKVIKFVKG
jgi:hypothetical protein